MIREEYSFVYCEVFDESRRNVQRDIVHETVKFQISVLYIFIYLLYDSVSSSSQLCRSSQREGLEALRLAIFTQKQSPMQFVWFRMVQTQRKEA